MVMQFATTSNSAAARVHSGHAAEPAISVMNSRRCIRHPSSRSSAAYPERGWKGTGYVGAVMLRFQLAQRNVSTTLRQPSVEFKLGLLEFSSVN
jgi:hypothetical protein